MIQIKKPKYERDNYCVCCRKPFEDSMAITFSHKDYGDSTIITLCGKCRRELMETLSKADSNSALDHIHNVVRDDAYRRGYEQGKADANHPEIPDSWIPVSERLPEKEDCPMDCLVTRKSKTIGNYTDMAVAESDGTWTHEDWKAITFGDRVLGKKAGLISTRDDDIVAWMPLPEPWKGEQHETD